MDEQNFFNFYYIIDCYFLYNDRYHKENKRKNPLILVRYYIYFTFLTTCDNKNNGKNSSNYCRYSPSNRYI